MRGSSVLRLRLLPVHLRAVDHHPLPDACRQQLRGGFSDVGNVRCVVAVAHLKAAKFSGFQFVNDQIIEMTQGREDSG